jgi:hypothetical protein
MVWNFQWQIKEESERKRFLELVMIVEDDMLFHLSLQAGKPGWFCQDVGAEKQEWKRAYLNWKLVKTVVPESLIFKVKVTLGITVHNAPKREACIHPLFPHDPVII